MVNDLIDALENRVHSAVDTIEVMRSEINELKEERRLLQDKLRELLGKMERIENGNGSAAAADRQEGQGTAPASPYGAAISPFGQSDSDF